MEHKPTPWKKWSFHSNTPIYPGIYILAFSENTKLENSDFVLTEDIIYIGMTNSKGGLRQRLIQFNNVIKGKDGHGGADRVMYNFYKCPEKLEDNLYISYIQIEADTKNKENVEVLLAMGEVAKLEYVYFAKFFEKFEVLPKYNRPNSPKLSKFKK